MRAIDILQIVELGEKLNCKTVIRVCNILGTSQYTVDYNNYSINDDYVYYNSQYRVNVKDVEAVIIK